MYMLWSQSFKHWSYGLACVCWLISCAFFFADPADEGTTISAGNLTKNEAAFALAVIAALCILSYHGLTWIGKKLAQYSGKAHGSR
jgi:hypothetical protein